MDDNHEDTIFKLDDWIVFKLDLETVQLFLNLRQKWNALFLRRMKAPGKPMSQLDEKVVNTLVTVLTNEEQACGLQQPSGIGQRPRPLIVDYYPANARRADDFVEVIFIFRHYFSYLRERKQFNLIFIISEKLLNKTFFFFKEMEKKVVIMYSFILF